MHPFSLSDKSSAQTTHNKMYTNQALRYDHGQMSISSGWSLLVGEVYSIRQQMNMLLMC